MASFHDLRGDVDALYCNALPVSLLRDPHVYVVPLATNTEFTTAVRRFVRMGARTRDEKAINRAITAEASRFHLSVLDNRMVSQDVASEWIVAAVLSVSNASTRAANAVVARFVAAAEEALTDK